MNIKINTQLAEELKELQSWLQEKGEDWTQKNQEQILGVISLISNPKFRKKIQALREKYNVPKEWYKTCLYDDIDRQEEYVEWTDRRPDAPIMSYDKVFVDLCHEFKVDPKMYGEFLMDYFMNRHVIILQPPTYEWFEYFYSQEEYRYRAKIEIEVDENDKNKPVYSPQGAYIRFYGDTSMTQLIEFIKKNQIKIKKLQKLLKPYPQTRRFKKFNRDIQVYLLNQLGLSTSEIQTKINEVDKDGIGETGIRQVVMLFNDRIKEITQF